MLLLQGFVVKQVCFLDYWLIVNFQGSHKVGFLFFFFFYLQSHTGVNYLITYFVSLFCPCHNHEIKTLAPWKKSYDQPRQHIVKQRHYFANKSLISQSYGFSISRVWIWELDYKIAECWRIDAFELWFWSRLLRVHWTAWRSNQSILKEISPEYSLEGLILKLKLQYFGHLMQEQAHWKRPWFWERLKAGGEGDDRGWNGWMASPTRWTRVWVNSGSWW